MLESRRINSLDKCPIAITRPGLAVWGPGRLWSLVCRVPEFATICWSAWNCNETKKSSSSWRLLYRSRAFGLLLLECAHGKLCASLFKIIVKSTVLHSFIYFRGCQVSTENMCYHHSRDKSRGCVSKFQRYPYPGLVWRFSNHQFRDVEKSRDIFNAYIHNE